MIIATVTYSVKPGTRDEVLAFAAEYSKAGHAAKGNLEHKIMASPNADEVFAIEKWETMDDLTSFTKTEACKIYGAKRKDYWLEETKNSAIYEATPVKR